MSNSADSGKTVANGALGAVADADLEVDEVVVETGVQRRSPFFAVPLLLGVVFLIADIYVFRQTPYVFTGKNTTVSISLLLIIVSMVICLILIGYAFALRRFGGAVSAKAVTAAVLLGLLAPLATMWSLQVNRINSDRTTKSCIDVYEQAQNIAKDNPKFRMPATDRDERRCSVNAALGR